MPPREGVSLNDPLVYQLSIGASIFFAGCALVLRYVPKPLAQDAVTDADSVSSDDDD